MSTFTAPIVGWLLHCFLPFTFVIARRHVTVNALCCRPLSPPIIIYHRHGRRCCCSQATITTTATPVVELTVIHCQRRRQ
jgi:hypothetical protein